MVIDCVHAARPHWKAMQGEVRALEALMLSEEANGCSGRAYAYGLNWLVATISVSCTCTWYTLHGAIVLCMVLSYMTDVQTSCQCWSVDV